MKKVVRWTFFFDEYYPETDWPISDEEEQEYELAVIQAIREHDYRISGFAHQGGQYCTPVFQDGKRYCCSFRSWGTIMAKALGIDDEYGYASWAWCAPEEEKLPVPSDWDETAEELAAQAERWEREQERQIQELHRDIRTLDTLFGERAAENGKGDQ